MKALRVLLISAILPLMFSVSPALAGSGRLRVLCSTYPMHLFTSAVAKGADGVSVDIMLPSSLGCPHDYILTPGDMQKLAEADLLVINGLGMEEFLGASLKKANPKIRIIDTSTGQKELVRLSGHNEHGHHAEKGHEHKAHDQGDFNPHLFSSPKRAAQIVKYLGESMSQFDGKNSSIYRRNAAFWYERLSGLAASYSKEAKTFTNRKIVTQHAVFDYLAKDFGLSIVAVVEEDPGQEPSASRMLEIIKTIRAKKAAALFTEPQYPAKVGDTIAKEAGIRVAVLDPVASGPDGKDLAYYEAVMNKNLETLKSVLGK